MASPVLVVAVASPVLVVVPSVLVAELRSAESWHGHRGGSVLPAQPQGRVRSAASTMTQLLAVIKQLTGLIAARGLRSVGAFWVSRTLTQSYCCFPFRSCRRALTQRK